MTHTPTPGQVAYAAYFAVLYDGEPHLRPRAWGHLHDRHRRAWEAAAQAVLVHAQQVGAVDDA